MSKIADNIKAFAVLAALVLFFGALLIGPLVFGIVKFLAFWRIAFGA